MLPTSMARMRFLLLTSLAMLLGSAAAAPAATVRLSSGGMRAVVQDDPWRVVFSQRGGEDLRDERGLGVRDPGGWRRAMRATMLRREGRAILAEVELEGGGTLDVRLAAARRGVMSLEVRGPATALATGAQFVAETDERFFGTGERSDAVQRQGLETENYVSDGPYREEDRNYIRAVSPPWAIRDRDDSTYFPIPWLLSSRGWGVLIDEDVTSRLRPAVDRPDRWDVEADGGRLRLRIFSGPTPAKALGRFTAAVGRQPEPQAPWTFGPWFQTGQPNVVPREEEREIALAQRKAGAPVSVAETQMHFLPCGAHRGRQPAERERTRSFHRLGLARLVYFNPLLCTSYEPVYQQAAAAGVLQKRPDGQPFVYPAFVGGSGPLGFTQEPLAQFDWTNPATEGFYAGLLREAVEMGNDGWMEDFGESTPTAGMVQHDGSSGDAAHNRYPTDFHCGVRRVARRFHRPLVRFQRSGWTGSARCAEVVWGGDPTTVWGFDGLSSAVRQVLSSGLSGVSRWGTDIGGYHSFGADFDAKPGATENEKLTPEMLTRWIELGALVPVMRTKRSGIAVPPYDRPQVYDEEHLPIWRALTELHLQLNPYLRAADEEHRRSGLPIVRHMMLTYPKTRQALESDDQWLLGPDLLAAPVTAPGVRKRSVWVPPGRWVDWWRSVRFADRDGAYRLEELRLVEGGRTTLRARLGEPPLLLRAGAILPLLSADVDTLAPYGRSADLVRLADREKVLRLLAVPRGTSDSRLPEGGTARSIEGDDRWTLRVEARHRMRFALEASLMALRRPFDPERVSVNGDPLAPHRWSYDPETRVLRAEATGDRVTLEVTG